MFSNYRPNCFPIPEDPLPTKDKLLNQLRANMAEDQTFECLICLEAGATGTQHNNATPAGDSVFGLPCCGQAVHDKCLAGYLEGAPPANTHCPHCRAEMCTDFPRWPRRLYQIGREEVFTHMHYQDPVMDHGMFMWVHMASFDRVEQAHDSHLFLWERDTAEFHGWVEEIMIKYDAQNFPANRYICGAHRRLGRPFAEVFVAQCIIENFNLHGFGGRETIKAFREHWQKVKDELFAPLRAEAGA